MRNHIFVCSHTIYIVIDIICFNFTMVTLNFPVGISQCLLSMGIAHAEPQWNFSVTSGKVTINLEWDHINTGTVKPGPPPEIHRQYFH